MVVKSLLLRNVVCILPGPIPKSQSILYWVAFLQELPRDLISILPREANVKQRNFWLMLLSCLNRALTIIGYDYIITIHLQEDLQHQPTHLCDRPRSKILPSLMGALLLTF